MLCAVYQQTGNAAALEEAALEAIRHHPNDIRFYLTAGTYAGRRQEFVRAVDILDKGLARWPSDPKLLNLASSALLGLGQQLLDQGNSAGAAAALSRAHEMAPGDVDILLNLGRAEHNLHRAADALRRFDRVVEQRPDTPLIRFHRGLALHSLGDFDAAIGEMTLEIDSGSNYGPAYMVRAMCWIAKGEWGRAAPDASQAAKLMPEDARAQFTWARCLMQSGDHKQAEVALRKTVALDKDDSAAANMLAQLLLRTARAGNQPEETKQTPVAIPRFVNTAAKAGLTIKVVNGDEKEKKFLPESIGGGLAVIDYNGDGWMDLYIVNGTTIEQARGGKITQRSALYRNNRDGTFTDVTMQAGVPGGGWGKGVLAADFNNDGWTDLYILNLGPNILYWNNGDGTFREGTRQAGVGGGNAWSSAAAAADFDKDGDLDLFVANYLEYDLNDLPKEGQFCEYQGIKVACGPRGLKGARDVFYRNNGDGTFTDISKESGLADEAGHYGLGAAWGDYDNDGDLDLFVANDSTPNYLYRNNGDGTFAEVALEAGVAYSEDGREQACMGVEFEDLDNDGLLDIMVTNFSEDYNTMYRNLGGGVFQDISHQAGLVADSWADLSWGVGFFDFNNDGWKDVFVGNGHIYPQVDRRPGKVRYRQTSKLYLNDGSRRLKNVSTEAGLTALKSSRGAAFADFNNDGWMDIAVVDLDEAPSLFINQGGENHWLMIAVKGDAARVWVKAGGKEQMREFKFGGSYASTNDPRAHFGLGTAEMAEEVRVVWRDGRTRVMRNVRPNRTIQLAPE